MADCDVLTVASSETDTLLHALARLADLDWTLTIVGSIERPLPPEIIDRVRTATELDGRFGDACCFVHAAGPSEPAPAVVEALCRGVPIALIGEAASLPPQVCVIVAPGAVDELSKALRRIVFDTALRTRMSDAARVYGPTLIAAA